MLKVICPHNEPEFSFSLQIIKKETKELLNQPSIGDKIFETFGEQNNPQSSPPFKVAVLNVFLQVARTAAQQCI